jgi:hypothetical protein
MKKLSCVYKVNTATNIHIFLHEILILEFLSTFWVIETGIIQGYGYG